MPFLMVRNDIVNMETDAIVNPSNPRLLQGRGTSRGIFLAAGEEELTQACRAAGYCELGHAVMTPGFALKAKYIIHAVCPEWRGGDQGEEQLLYSAYMESMKLAFASGLESISFPLLSSGNYHFPKEQAMRTAVRAIRDFLADHELTVYLVLYDHKAVALREEIAESLQKYLSDHYIEWIDDEYTQRKDESYFPQNAQGNYNSDMSEASAPPHAMSKPSSPSSTASRPVSSSPKASKPSSSSSAAPRPVSSSPKESKQSLALPRERRRASSGKTSRPAAKGEESRKERSLKDLLRHRPETFSEMLLRLIDERGLKDSDVYNKANIDRRHFSKIRKDPNYIPKKNTVFAFAIALELSYDETRDLLRSAGYAFTEWQPTDVIIRFYIENGNYDVFDINEALFYYEQPVLGA